MKKGIILTFIIGAVLTGCKDDFLEIVPETSLSSATFFTKEADFQQAVNGAYAPLRSIVNDRAWLLGELHSDNAYYNRNPLFGATEQEEDLADFAVPAANGVTSNVHVLNQYRLDYQIIARTNQILASIDNVEFKAESKNNIKGQALFLRAYAYFELARYFGSVPLHLTPVANRQEAALPLSQEEEVYAQIIQDASEAIPLLPPKSQQEAGRVTSGAARTLLANVYIVQKRWSEAEALLKEVVSSNEYDLMPDYADAFSNNASNKNNIESVFEVQFMEGAAGLNGNFLYRFLPRPMSVEEVVAITGTSNPQPLDIQGYNIPTPDLIAAYEEGDEREEATIAYTTISGSARQNKVFPYIKKYAKTHSLHNNHGINWPVYRYSEVLLFLAEALAQQGKSGEAETYLNIVRNRAGLDDYSGGNLLEGIYHERRVELAFENKRWFDLVRTGRAVDVITAYGERIKANPQDYYYPEGAAPRPHVFNNISLYYALPADEAALSPHF
ncbi:putative outer membrane starch-binding protein [Pontibacter ummariensis]|uniref:Starch-binding associating with outer membrane n=1 Tax=Pontibacter ummariensis TaxID=1610492 RepID=A0A239LNW0_9BACT|nr:RagB/SusD family nutrient uptake outer membrane protein [Pontibacter ummariensis]PRY02928.1 putative outer membrane starch-binding protein [Pontibacter ummariensis]SNT32131.1 Starch-binding associating with outer membrane [Pontibacter ummariensis]